MTLHAASLRYLPGAPSVRHQRRHGHGLQHAARHAAEDSLLQAGMAVAAHDDEIDPRVRRHRQDGGLNI